MFDIMFDIKFELKFDIKFDIKFAIDTVCYRYSLIIKGAWLLCLYLEFSPSHGEVKTDSH